MARALVGHLEGTRSGFGPLAALEVVQLRRQVTQTEGRLKEVEVDRTGLLALLRDNGIEDQAIDAHLDKWRREQVSPRTREAAQYAGEQVVPTVAELAPAI